MREEDLEGAICKCFEALLPDLVNEGYALESRQVTIINGRIDLLLRREADGHFCIIELKAGSPPMPATKQQILRYAAAWRASFSSGAPPRLIVIGTSLSEKKKLELRDAGIDGRSITEAQVQKALDSSTDPISVPRGILIPKEGIERIREIISDHEALLVPPGIKLEAPWDQLKICLALVSAGAIHKPRWRKDIGVRIYEQEPGCAVLYLPNTRYSKAPLHLNPTRSSWRQDIFERMEPFIQYVKKDNKGLGNEKQNFYHYKVLNWNGLAEALGLENGR